MVRDVEQLKRQKDLYYNQQNNLAKRVVELEAETTRLTKLVEALKNL